MPRQHERRLFLPGARLSSNRHPTFKNCRRARRHSFGQVQPHKDRRPQHGHALRPSPGRRAALSLCCPELRRFPLPCPHSGVARSRWRGSHIKEYRGFFPHASSGEPRRVVVSQPDKSHALALISAKAAPFSATMVSQRFSRLPA
jgi:hypothetical protein